MTDQLVQSDKSYWHLYLPFYEQEFAGLQCRAVLEFGVWRGASVRWLLERFPNARIHGVDIIEQHPSWPLHERVRYYQADQGKVGQINHVLESTGEVFDLIIDDGSHFPAHQRNCLVAALSHIRSGGCYVLEDIHTSHPKHPYFKKAKPWFTPMLGPLQLLLAIEHIQTLDETLALPELSKLSINSLFSAGQVKTLFDQIASVKVFRRSHLPQRCFVCGESRFDYSRLRCECGAFIYAEADSMSAVIRIR